METFLAWCAILGVVVSSITAGAVLALWTERDYDREAEIAFKKGIVILAVLIGITVLCFRIYSRLYA